jgi:predicted DNA-binding ribbon-helix-helix protein
MMTLRIRTLRGVTSVDSCVSFEDAFWNGLREIANVRNETLSSLVGSIAIGRQHANLSSAVRLFVLGFYRNRLGPQESLAT